MTPRWCRLKHSNVWLTGGHAHFSKKVLGTFSTCCIKIILRRSSTAAKIFGKSFFLNFTCNHCISWGGTCQNCALCDTFFEIWHGYKAGHKIFKNHWLQDGTPSWWPLDAKLKMAASRFITNYIASSADCMFKCSTICIIWQVPAQLHVNESLYM